MRHTCRVQAFEGGVLLCHHRFSHSTEYRAEDIETLIGPAVFDHICFTFAALLTVGGAIITGACFLAAVTIIGAVPVAIVGGFLALFSPVVFINDPPGQDRVVYQRQAVSINPLANRPKTD